MPPEPPKMSRVSKPGADEALDVLRRGSDLEKPQAQGRWLRVE
ncbi:Hypothetical protein A7982_02056 [Minicystis rosea]|nr:Hypothetical protein A7982_02056 [Minicystis rosea]